MAIGFPYGNNTGRIGFGGPTMPNVSPSGGSVDPNAPLTAGGPAGSPGNDYEDPYWEPYQAQVQQIEADPNLTPEQKAQAKKAAYDQYVANRNADQQARKAQVNKTAGASKNDVWRQYMSFGGPRYDQFGNQLAPYDFAQGKQAQMSDNAIGAQQNSMGYMVKADQALGRAAPTLDLTASNKYAGMGDTDRLLQTNAGWAMLTAANEPMGPSAAEAMLRRQSDATMAGNLAMARSGRGRGYSPAAMRAAAFANAQQQNQLGTALAAERAAEIEAFKERQLRNRMGAAQAGTAARSGDLAAQEQGFGQAKSAAELEQEQQRINNALFKDTAGLGIGWQQIAQGWEGQGFDYGQAQSDLARDILAIQQQQYAGDADRRERQQAGLIGAGGAVLGSAIAASDKRDKKNVRPMYRYGSSDVRAKKSIRDEDVAAALGDAAARTEAGIRTPRAVYPRRDDSLFAELEAAGEQADTIRSTRAVYPELGPAAARMAAEAPGYSYEYRDPSAPGAAPGRHFGPMAQDLEKTPVGRSVVVTGPDGKKAVDTGRLALATTAAVGEQQRQIADLEAELERMRRAFGETRAVYPELR